MRQQSDFLKENEKSSDLKARHLVTSLGVQMERQWSSGFLARHLAESLGVQMERWSSHCLEVCSRRDPPMQPWRLILFWKAGSPHALLPCVGW